MVQTFQDFATAMRSQNGYLLASCISPTPPTDDPARLYTFYRFTNRMSVEADVRYAIQYDGDTKHELGRQEQMVWSSVFVEYWRAVGEILAAEETANAGRGREEEGRKKKGEEGWDRVYDAWKEVVKVLNKGYQASLLPAWTIPCLYIAAKYLRVFAIKADNGAKRMKGRGGLSFNAAAGLQDDVVGSVDGQERLEEAARMINTMFSLCINDRAPIEESRKWGVYYMTNLLFKTFFKVIPFCMYWSCLSWL
ncbi:COP9 signalosome (CSN) subunit [Elasticomyces elasticus]|nr:COP9 signalosome (CSN) subunit [Elasticomyces elasticus]